MPTVAAFTAAFVAATGEPLPAVWEVPMPPPVAPQMITISKMTASDRMKRFFLNQGRLALGWALCELVCAWRLSRMWTQGLVLPADLASLLRSSRSAGRCWCPHQDQRYTPRRAWRILSSGEVGHTRWTRRALALGPGV